MRYKSLDGLRGLAAYTVVISHFGNHTHLFGSLTPGSGQLGVMLFFVLSGFLMSRLYIETPFTLSNVAEFYQKRLARVVPLYLIVVLISYFWTAGFGEAWPFFPITDGNLWKHLTFWRGWSILWTIPAEVQFYAGFWLFWLIYSRGGESALAVWLALSIAVVAMFGFPYTPAVLAFLPFFLIGVGISMIPRPTATGSVDLLFAVMLVGYFLIYPGVREALGIMSGELRSSPVYLAFMPAFLLATLWSPLAERTLGSEPARFFGNISYSAYLLHVPVLNALVRTPLEQHHIAFLIVFLALTTIVAWLSFRYIETPCRRAIAGLSLRKLLPVPTRQPAP